jgi:hypothetical protein
MRARWLLIAVALAMACGTKAEPPKVSDDPSRRLSPGDSATIYSAEEMEAVPLLAGKEWPDLVKMGSRVTVVSDNETGENNPLFSPISRPVKVNVMEGPQAGQTGTVCRMWLRPVR